MNGATVVKYVFDTCAVTFLLKEDKRMIDLLPDLETGDWFASVITRMELRAEPGMPAEKVKKVEAFLGYAAVITMDDAVEEVAVSIRRDFRPKVLLPDCIVAATAIVLGATLLTDDTSLKDLVWPGYTVKPL